MPTPTPAPHVERVARDAPRGNGVGRSTPRPPLVHLLPPQTPPQAHVERTCLPFVWWIHPDGWEGAWQAFGTRAHAERKARKVLARLTRGRETFTVTL